jgi:ABC-2 type transport system ATP-binding protein
MTAAAVAVQKLSKRFPVPRPWVQTVLHPLQRSWATALDGIDLEVPKGEIFGLLGPNGAGKTTLLKVLCTQLRPSGGTASIFGHDVVTESSAARKALGCCLDVDRSFYYRLTGRQNLEFFASLNNLKSHDAGLRTREALGMLTLEAVADKPFMTYSRGQRQKLALARALLTDASLLLLDEPTSSLDPMAAIEFRRFIRDTVAKTLGKTILLVTHNLEEADECCGSAAVMERGKIVFRGSGADVRGFIRSRGDSRE